MGSVEDRVKTVVDRRGVSPKNQKVMWASMKILQHYLIKSGVITKEQFEKERDRLVGDIERNIENNVRKELGLKPKG